MFKKIQAFFLSQQGEPAAEEKPAGAQEEKFVLVSAEQLFSQVPIPQFEIPMPALDMQPVFTLHNLSQIFLPNSILRSVLPERRLEESLGLHWQEPKGFSKLDLAYFEETKRSRPRTEEYHNPAPKNEALSRLYHLAPALWLRIYQYLDAPSQLQFDHYDRAHYLGCSSLLGNEGLESRSPAAIPTENYKVYNDDPHTGFFMK